MKRLILASGSPRRRELLGLLGLPFTVQTSDFDEDSVPTAGLTPSAWVQCLAEGKARAVAGSSKMTPWCWARTRPWFWTANT